MTTRITIQTLAFTLALVGCDLYSAPDELEPDASGPVACEVVASRDTAEGCRTACTATRDRDPLGQMCQAPNIDYPDCEAQCKAGIADGAWCP